MAEAVRVFARRFNRFAATLRWMTIDALWRFRGSTLWILGGGLTALALQVGAIGLSAAYAHALEQGDPVAVFGRDYDARSSGTLLAMCGGAVLLLLLGSAWLAWMSRRHEVRLLSRYQEFCTRRALDWLGGPLFVLPVGSDAAYDARDVRRTVRGDAAFLGRAVRLLVAGVVPGVTFVLAGVTLLVLEPVITLVTIGVVLVSVAFLYRVNLAAAHSSHALEAQLPRVAKEMNHLMAGLRDRSAPTIGAQELREPFASGGFRGYLDARDARMFAMERGRFVSNAFLAVVMFAVIVMLGIDLIAEGTGWGRLLIYIVALRHGLVNFRSFTTMLTSINRFHKQISRYRTLLHAAESNAAEVREAPSGPLAIHCTAPEVAESATALELHPGACALVATPLSAGRYMLGALLAALAPRDAASWQSSVAFAGAPAHVWSGGDPVGVGSPVTEAEVRRLAGSTALADAVVRLAAEVESGWDTAPRPVRLLYTLAAALRHAPALLVVPAAEFARLPDDVQQQVREALHDVIVLLVGGERPIPAQLPVDHVIVGRPTAVAGLGDWAWWCAQRSAIESALGLRSGAIVDDADEMDEEELLG